MGSCLPSTLLDNLYRACVTLAVPNFAAIELIPLAILTTTNMELWHLQANVPRSTWVMGFVALLAFCSARGDFSNPRFWCYVPPGGAVDEGLVNALQEMLDWAKGQKFRLSQYRAVLAAQHQVPLWMHNMTPEDLDALGVRMVPHACRPL